MISKHSAARQIPFGLHVNVLSDRDVERIHDNTLAVLSKTGIWVEKAEARQVFEAGGAQVDETRRIVKLPPKLVEAAVVSAPATVYLAGRHAERTRDMALLVTVTRDTGGTECLLRAAGRRGHTELLPGRALQ